MTFNIYAAEGVDYSDDLPKCEIEINGYLENCPLITDLWSLKQYRHQWENALSHLYERKVSKCMLVTDVNKMHINTALTFWALYAVGDLIYIREIFIKNPGIEKVVDPFSIEEYIHAREGDEDDEDIFDSCGTKLSVSEWTIKFEDIAHLIQ